LLDVYKCGGTPYALVYAKEESLPNVSYNYYRNFAVASGQGLVEMEEQKNNEK
jgi:hypothetical protein